MDKCAVCGVLTESRCSSCNAVSYCSREHQIADWKAKHKNKCKSYEIKRNEKLGRYMIAKRDISAGEVIFHEKPLLLGPKVLSRVICLGCHRLITTPSKTGDFYKCSKCTWPMCGEECEKLACHEDECRAMSERKFKSTVSYSPVNVGRIQTCYTVITPLRFILMRKSDPKKYKIMSDLVSHLEQRIHSKLYAGYRLNLIPFIKQFLQFDMSEREILNIAGILDTNTFDVFVPSKQIRIRGMYPTTAMMAHECIPNTKHFVDTNCEMKVIACSDIKRGEMILTSYSHPLSTTIERRIKIKDAKCFDCDCPRCSDATEFQTFCSSINCFKCSNGRLVSVNPLENQAAWVCLKCNTSFKFDQVYAVIRQVRNSLDELDKRSPEECENFLKEFGAILPPSSVFLVDVKYALCLLIGNNVDYPIERLSLAHLNRKVELCNELLEIFKIIEPGQTNSVANVQFELSLAKIAQFKIAKALASDPKAHDAEFNEELAKAQKARDILLAGSEWKSLIENRMKKAFELCALAALN